MGDWGRGRGRGRGGGMGRGRNQYGNYYQEKAPMSYQHRKPPPGPWQPTVSSWEKTFYTKVCRIPWKRLLEVQRVMGSSMYDGVLNWDDSGAKEAFYNAKSRYWALINNQPSDVCLPDPDLHVDKVDWSAKTDPELLLDLEREPDEAEENGKTELAADTLYLMNQPVVCSGWGDAEETVGKDNNPSNAALLSSWVRNGGKKNTWEEGNEKNPWEGDLGGYDTNASNKNNAWEKGCDNNPWERNFESVNKNAKNNAWGEGYDNEQVNPWEQGKLDGKPFLVPNVWGEASGSALEKPNNVQWKNDTNSQWENNSKGWPVSNNSQWKNDTSSQWESNNNRWGDSNNARWKNNTNSQWENNNNWWEGSNNDQWKNNTNSPWENNDHGWGGSNDVQWKNSTDSQWENNNIEWQDSNNGWGYPSSSGQLNENWMKREGDGHYLSRYKTTRFQGEGYGADNWGRNERGRKRVNFAQENPRTDKKPLAPRQCYPVHACGPTSQSRPGNSWGWGRQLS